ncbi:hypothetical protein BP6252_11745 [Coleophoma cylindrospora]|uniref:Uncharacterized protein n=1 Tax=Coleophoma cylindrospora TaxID=1849047 RepID=A0A3D8QKI4_9HELO|nr:hypothetical protein BP6252_11745 [Coleophoma cylindrospora]
MAFAVLAFLAGGPAVLGLNEAIRQGVTKERREEHRARRVNLLTHFPSPTETSMTLEGKRIVLRNKKLYIEDKIPSSDHPFTGYFLDYPNTKYEGLVSSITYDPPIMNWIYVDGDTFEVKYGPKIEAHPHYTGPFDCTRGERRLIFGGWEGFSAVQEQDGAWALYFDVLADGLQKVPGDKLELVLERREVRGLKGDLYI